MELALHRSAERLGKELTGLPFEPYAPIRRQLLAVLRAVNRERQRAGFELVPRSCFRFVRRVCRPFEPATSIEEGAVVADPSDGECGGETGSSICEKPSGIGSNDADG